MKTKKTRIDRLEEKCNYLIDEAKWITDRYKEICKTISENSDRSKESEKNLNLLLGHFALKLQHSPESYFFRMK